MKTADVPKYLQCGDFYLSLICDDEDITVPTDCCKIDDQIYNVDDLQHLLRSLRFWLVGGIPDSLLGYIFENPREEVFNIVVIFGNDLTYMPMVLEVARAQDKMLAACALGNLEIVNYLHKTGHNI